MAKINTIDVSKLDDRISQLEERGFKHTRVGLNSDELTSAILYSQIEEPSDEEWSEFMLELDVKKESIVNP